MSRGIYIFFKKIYYYYEDNFCLYIYVLSIFKQPLKCKFGSFRGEFSQEKRYNIKNLLFLFQIFHNFSYLRPSDILISLPRRHLGANLFLQRHY